MAKTMGDTNQELDSNNDSPSNTPRPFLLTMVLLVGFVDAFVHAQQFLWPDIGNIVSWYPLFLLLYAAGAVVGLIGLWKLKRWGFWVYLAVLASEQAVLIVIGSWISFALFIPALLGIATAAHYKILK